MATRMSAEYFLQSANQARSMLSAGFDVAPERIEGSNRRAHVQVMQAVIPSVFLRSVVGALIAMGLTIAGRFVGLPDRITDIATWSVAMAVPCVGAALWFALLAMRLFRRSIRAAVESDRAGTLLWSVSVFGYVIAILIAVVGVVAFPGAFA